MDAAEALHSQYGGHGPLLVLAYRIQHSIDVILAREKSFSPAAKSCSQFRLGAIIVTQEEYSQLRLGAIIDFLLRMQLTSWKRKITLARESRSISSCRILRSISSRCCGFEVISIFSLAADSSTWRQHAFQGQLMSSISACLTSPT